MPSYAASCGLKRSPSLPYRLDTRRIEDSGDESQASPTDSDSSDDEEDINRRIQPYWPKYQNAFRSRGFRLETVRDVKNYYRQKGTSSLDMLGSQQQLWNRVDLRDDDALCPDAGFPDNLFRGVRLCDSRRVVVKAVHRRSNEVMVIRVLSQPPLRDDPMNHTIPVLDLFEVVDDEIAFIVMEEWSSQLVTSGGPCCLSLFLAALRQCIEHAVFMHKHGIAHLDISLRNLLTDYEGHYAYIDYELSRRFNSPATSVRNYRGTEIPPECEKEGEANPFKIDVWALAVLILRACKMTGYWVPELMQVIEPMMNQDPRQRPSSREALIAFDRVISSLGYRIGPACSKLQS